MKRFSQLLIALLTLVLTTPLHSHIQTVEQIHSIKEILDDIAFGNPQKKIQIFRCEAHNLENLQILPDIIIFITNKRDSLVDLQTFFAEQHPKVTFIGLHVLGQWEDQWNHY